MGTDTQPRLHDKAYNEAHDVLFMAYSTLCGPCGTTELIDGALVTSIGKKYNKTGAQISLKWVVQQGIPVIPKAQRADYLAQNLDLWGWELSHQDMQALTAATSPPETGTPANPDDAQDCSAE